MLAGTIDEACDQMRVMAKPQASKRGTTTVSTFRSEPLFPRIERVVAAILKQGKVVTPIDVLVRMQLLTTQNVEDWRRGRVPYLERVIHCNLTRLSRLLRILRFHAHDLNLVPSTTVYVRWGRGPKHRLRFTKTGDPRIEEAYARHFVWPGKRPFSPPAPSASQPGTINAPPDDQAT